MFSRNVKEYLKTVALELTGAIAGRLWHRGGCLPILRVLRAFVVIQVLFTLPGREKTLCCQAHREQATMDEAPGMRYWTECREFYGQFRRQYFTTGSILPSSRGLARALVSEFRRRPGPATILEVGPGTGAVTAGILRELRPGDRLDIVEINQHFVNVLQRRFAEEPLFHRRRDQVHLMHAPLQELPGAERYDYMISGLPLNNFPIALVRDIFRSYQRLLRKGGVLSYFEYLWIRSVKTLFVSRPERRRLHVLSRLLDRRIAAAQFREDWVLGNVPPAVARHLRFQAS